MYYLY